MTDSPEPSPEPDAAASDGPADRSDAAERGDGAGGGTGPARLDAAERFDDASGDDAGRQPRVAPTQGGGYLTLRGHGDPARPAAFAWTATVFMAVALVVLAPFFVLSPLGVLAAGLTPFMLIGSAIYGVVGVAVITLRWVVVPRVAGHGQAASAAPGGAYEHLVENFATGPQRLSLALTLVLLVDLGCVAALYPQQGDAPELALVACGGVAFLGAFLLIAANARWAYPRRVILAEHHALTTRTGAWRLIVLNRVLAYAIWLPATGIALYFSTSQHLVG